jgi:Fe-S oxidoreductase
MSGAGRPRVLYFAGCYASYLRPEIGSAAVGVLKRMGMTILSPPQHCCGLPLLSKGMVDPAREKIVANQAAFGELLHGCDHIVVTCSSCGLALSKEWRDLAETGFIKTVADKMIHISALVNRYRHRLPIRRPFPPLAYHLPCHLAAQPAAGSSLEMLAHIPGGKPLDLQGHCCGMAGSWGMLAANEELSRHIGMDLVQRVERSGAPVVATDCPTCRMQLEDLTEGKKILHPIEVVAQGVVR